MNYRPFAPLGLAIIFAFVVVTAALRGPLKSYVPSCSEISLGFCFDRNKPKTGND